MDCFAEFVPAPATLRLEAEGIVRRGLTQLVNGLPAAPLVIHRAECSRCSNRGFWMEGTTGARQRRVLCPCGSWFDRAQATAPAGPCVIKVTNWEQ